MPYETPELTEPEVLPHALSTLHDHLPLHAEGYTCTTDDLFKVLLGVAVNRATLESVCADLGGSPDPQTIRGSLNEQLRGEEVPELERQLKDALAAELPPRVRRHTREVASDYQDRPYDGKGTQAADLWVRGQAQEGTTRFYRGVATADVVLKGLRLTLALGFVLPDDDTVSVVATLRKRGKRLGIAITCLLLDKGVASIGVRAYLASPPQHPPLTQEKRNEFLAGKHNAILATIKKDGSPQLTPVVYRWDGEKFWVSTTKDRAKYKNILRDPRVSLCIDDAATVTTVIASGKAQLTEDNLWSETLNIVERYQGPEQGAAYVKSMQKQKEPRVLLLLKPEQVISWGH